MSRPLIAAGLVGVALAGSAGGYLAASSGGEAPAGATLDVTTGWATPQDAVRALFTAAAHGDLLAVMQTLVPGEQSVDVAESEALVTQLQRLGVLASSFDLADLGGLSVTVTGTKLSVRTLAGGDLALVSLIGGSVTSRGDAGQVALGSLVRGLAGSALDRPASVSRQPIGSHWTGWAPLRQSSQGAGVAASGGGATGVAASGGGATGVAASGGGATGIPTSGASVPAVASSSGSVAPSSTGSGSTGALGVQQLDTAAPAAPSYPPAIVTVRVGSSWYVSLGWTIAADAQQARGVPFAPPANGVTAVASATPEDAVRSLIDDAAAIDPAGVLSVLAPGEDAALQAYASSALSSAAPTLERLRSAVHVSVAGMQLSSEQIAEGQLVKVSDLAVTASIDLGAIESIRSTGSTGSAGSAGGSAQAAGGSTGAMGGLQGLLGGAGATLHLSWAHGCFTLQLGPVSDRQCGASASQRAALSQLLSLLPSDVASSLRRLSSVQPDAGIVTVQEGGSWYVSPSATSLHALESGLAVLQPSDLQAWASFLRDPAALQRVVGGLAQLGKNPVSLLTAFHG